MLSALFTTSCNEIMSNLDQPVSSYLTVNDADIVVPTGDTYQIEAASINSDKVITYKSSDEKVATVDANGLVTGIADGEATITVAVEASENYNAGEQKIQVAVKRPLTFEALEDGQINVNYVNGIILEKPIIYTINKGKKQEISTNTSIAVQKGDKVEFESANERTATDKDTYYVNIQPQSKCAVYGNVMSMISPDGNYHTNKTITQPYALVRLLQGAFYWGDDLVYYTVSHDKYDLVLPATTLTESCYYGLLTSTGITKAPELPATELAPYCYGFMFNYCQYLTTAPKLPAKKLDLGCYYYMFSQCGLTEAPDLPATELETGCYFYMFQYNMKLEKAPALPATKLAAQCYRGMFSNTGLKEAPALSATDLKTRCYQGMFESCTKLEKVPEKLPAENLADYCYYNMFAGCTSLTKAPALPAENLAERCYSDMFAGCTSLTKAPALPAENLAKYCYNYMFGGCTALTEAPELKAATLAYGSYCAMFMDCSKLSKVTCLATTNAIDALGMWLSGAGTDASVTKRTLVRAESNKKWTNNDVWTWGTANWYVPTSWTIEPPIIKTIVLVPGVWDLDNARFAAYVWRNTPSFEEHWYLFSNENDKWTTNIPATYTGLVLARLDNGTEVNWGSSWNQTSNIDFTNVADNSTISITGWGGPGNYDPYTITAP